MRSANEIRAILKLVDAGEYSFDLRVKDGQMFLVASYNEQDVVTGENSIQVTRKWYISPHVSRSELVQTAFKCVLTSHEHRVREAFTYKGRRIFGPHFDCDALHEICKDRANLDYRDPMLQDGVEDDQSPQAREARMGR